MLARKHCHSSAAARPRARGTLQPARQPVPPLRAAEPTTSTVVAEPTVTVRFEMPDGAEAVTLECPSGEQLRYFMLDSKVDLYTTWGKIWSCGGAGQCGTCIVQVSEGSELLSEKNSTEQKKLKGKPESWRLACQTIVGDGTNSGTLVIKTKPQSK